MTRETRIQLALFLLLTAGLAVTYAGHGSFVDENLIMQVCDSLAQRGNLEAMPGFQALPGPDGKFYSRYGIGFVLIMMPFYYIGEILFILFGHSAVFFHGSHYFACLWGALLITAAAGLLMYRVVRLLGAGETTGVLLALVLVWGSPFWPYSQTLFRQTTAAALLLLLLELILRHQRAPARRHLIRMVLCVTLLLNVREDAVIASALMGLYALTGGGVRDRAWRAAALLAGAAAAALVWGLHNYIRFGAFFIENYEDIDFNYPLIVSIPALLFSSSRGIVPYAPLCLLLPASLAVSRKKDRMPFWILCLVIFTAYLVLYGKSNMWHGGRCWGPRHLYFLLPFALAPAAWLLESPHRRVWIAVTLALAAIGAWMNWPGVYAHQGMAQSYFNAPGFFELVRRPIGNPDYITFDDLDLWWIRMIRMHPLSIAPAAFAATIGCAGYAARRLWIELRESS
ncbi:MAG: hypothetical protein GC154_05850 [bacterium]|nr:hypothetical protein [bacterium]